MSAGISFVVLASLIGTPPSDTSPSFVNLPYTNPSRRGLARLLCGAALHLACVLPPLHLCDAW